MKCLVTSSFLKLGLFPSRKIVTSGCLGSVSGVRGVTGDELEMVLKYGVGIFERIL